MRHQSPCHKKDKFKDVFAETEKYLMKKSGLLSKNEDMGNSYTWQKAVSFKDLHKRVSEIVPEGTAIPSVKW